jgi:hypothetical protein
VARMVDTILPRTAFHSTSKIWRLLWPRSLLPRCGVSELWVSLSQTTRVRRIWLCGDTSGYYLGIPSDILNTHFGKWSAADAFLDSAVLHLFTFPEDPAVAARLPTIPVLRAVAAKGGLGAATRPVTAQDTQLGYHLALSRSLLGVELGSALGLPTPSWSDAFRVRGTFLAMAGPIWFGRLWRSGWEERRSECIRRALPRVVAWTLGRRRTTFWAGPIRGVQVREGDHRWDKIDPEAEEWVEEGRWIVKNWALVWREMMGVVGGMVLMAAVGAVWSWRVLY